MDRTAPSCSRGGSVIARASSTCWKHGSEFVAPAGGSSFSAHYRQSWAHSNPTSISLSRSGGSLSPRCLLAWSLPMSSCFRRSSKDPPSSPTRHSPRACPAWSHQMPDRSSATASMDSSSRRAMLVAWLAAWNNSGATPASVPAWPGQPDRGPLNLIGLDTTKTWLQPLMSCSRTRLQLRGPVR